ncbi:MAG: acryloyl-CoA reductase [Proteobacteria bacterium]|jgi:NADPH2:quinone reductase|nr:acryloyl-CoA reductase [Pseudomonadota bacterium]
MPFKAFRIHQQEKGVSTGFEDLEVENLTDGDVVVRVAYSGINFKDALAATGAAKILRAPELNGGIDFSGVVESSESSNFRVGQKVLVCGCGLSETRDGGFSEVARVPAECVVSVPDSLDLREVMALGTAGFTAAIAMIRLEENGQDPSQGQMIVTGATGGVGSIVIDMLSAKGFDVVALTGKSDQHDYLRQLGASDFIDRHSVEMGSRPLEKGLWGGAVDNVGGETLGWLTRTVQPWGSIASIGNASGIKLETTVMPFILRGVSLLGINSIEMPSSLRNKAWKRLSEDLKPGHLDLIAPRTINFSDLPGAFDEYLTGSVVGRTVVRIGS